MRTAFISALLLATPVSGLAIQAEPEKTIQTPKPSRDASDPWEQILSQYVIASDDGVNRFDYAALQSNAEDRETLSHYIDHLSGTQLSSLSADEKFARLANLYNALTIRLLVEYYPVKSIRDIRYGLFSTGPWKKNIIKLDGKEVSLDDIEHGMLREQFTDPRVHYAVNCASIGCPNLQPKAWAAETLDADLTKAARAYINHPRGVTVLEDGRLQVSRIYAWFKEDFGGNEKGVIAHILKYADDELAAKLRNNPDISDYAYDWSLNDAKSVN